MRASLVAISTALLVTSTLVAGCDREEPESRPDAEAGDSTGDESTVDGDVVVAGGDVELTIEDVEAAVDRLRLLAPGDGPDQLPDRDAEWMKHPGAQISLLRQLERFAIVRHAARQRGIEVDDEDVRRVIADHDQLAQFLPLLEGGPEADAIREEFQRVGLGADDLKHLARDMAYDQKLEQRLVEEFPDDRLWGIYQRAEDAADVVVATITNSPTSSEIDSAVRRYDAEIREEYQNNPERYVVPAQVRATALTAGDDTDGETFKRAARRLEEGDEPADVAAQLGLEVDEDVRINRHRHPEAYQANPGETGVSQGKRRGRFAWRIEDRTEEQQRSLDRPLRREIASRILQREEGMTPSSRRRAREAREILAEPAAEGPLEEDEIQSLVDRLEQRDFEAVHTGLFSVRQQAARLPEIGLAENLFGAVGQLDFDDPVTDPVLDRDSIRVARLVDRKHPDRETFEAEREEYREEFLEKNRSQLVAKFVDEYRQKHEFQYQTELLADRFGLEQPKSGGAGRTTAPNGP